MKNLTTDPNDPRLWRGHDDVPVDQGEVYLVLPQSQRQRGFVKPVRPAYKHAACGAVTTMCREIAETYARDPFFYGATYCCKCRKHRPLWEFKWEPDGERMDPADWPEAERERVRSEVKRLSGPQIFGRTVSDGTKLADGIG